MTSKIFYVVQDSKFLQNDGTFAISFSNIKQFTTEQAVIDYIDQNLVNGEYAITQKIVKA